MGNNRTALRLVEDRKRDCRPHNNLCERGHETLGEGRFSMGTEVGSDMGQAGGHNRSESTI
jgi:hypothetical protein